MLKKILLALACLTFMTISSHASATNIYIAQNSTGAANGADCGDAKPVSFFNTSGNWGSGSAQIGPGTTVHLCGTFSGGNSANMLTVQGGGSNGSPVTILFEPGAILTAPYWDGNTGAIYCSGFNYVTLDGGTNGLITSTANGTNLANQQASFGVHFDGCDHSEIRNLTVNPVYVHVGTGSDGSHNSFGIADYGVTVASVHNNSVQWAFSAIDVNWANGASQISVYSNTTDYHCWGLSVGDESGGSSSASGVNIYNNSIGPHFDAFLDIAQTMHGDGMIINAPGPSGVLSNSSIYDNYVHGDLSANPSLNTTAYVFANGVFNSLRIFNNVLVHEAGNNGPEGIIRLANYGLNTFQNICICNNTIVSTNEQTAGIKMDGGTVTVKNNIFINIGYGILSNITGFGAVTAADYNDYYNVSHLASAQGGVYIDSLSAMQALGFESHGSTANPNLSSSYQPQTGSAAAGMGTNLTALGISQLDSDKAGVSRPSSGTWVVGAYTMGSGAAPAPPSSLVATVQ